ncbi:PepSY domain-containing protein [Mycoplasmatota bacterium]|nr:PepSY domain-containing protein [Mycoplasmatota bacterium]
MKDNNKLEKVIYEQFNQRKPEIFDKILEQCPKMKNPRNQESLLSKVKNVISTKRFSYSFASLSLVLVLVFIMFGLGNTTTSHAFSTIAIDVNPSLVLELDEDDKVINVILNNKDAEIIVGDMDIIGVDYNVAINALIGSMVANGYISELTNSVLLSISSDNEVREDELMAELSQVVNDVLTGNQIDGSVIVQDLEFEEDAEELAELLGISEAKAELILDIIEADPRMTVEELAKLSINDLNLLLEAKNITLDNVEKIGSASELGIITVKEAYQAALTELEIDELTVVEFEIELGQEDGVMVYEVEIETDTEEYEILIDAKEGTVFVDLDEDEDNDNDDDDFPVDALTEQEVLNVIATELGLDTSLITELEIEQEVDNGVAYYEVEFEYNGEEYELEIDASTGEIYTNSMDEEGFNFDDDDNEDDELDDEEETED